MSKRGIKRGGTVVALGTVAALATVGVGFASIPSSVNNVISACYAKDTADPGALRVIDAQAGVKCRTNEVALNFNQRGPRARPARPTSTGRASTPRGG